VLSAGKRDDGSRITNQYQPTDRKNECEHQAQPEIFLNVLMTAFADRVSELWEFGLEVYYSEYPSSAEGVSLDYAAQFGGSMRDAAAKTFYPVHCECIDGTQAMDDATYRKYLMYKIALTILLPIILGEAQNLIDAHNVNPMAHPNIRTSMAQIEGGSAAWRTCS
jgi:hypothetical protein